MMRRRSLEEQFPGKGPENDQKHQLTLCIGVLQGGSHLMLCFK